VYEPEGYYVIKGRFTWAQLEPVLGNSEYGIQRDNEVTMSGEGEPCGLLPSPTGLTYKIYSSWREPIGGMYAHVVLHPNGICFSGALRVEQDWLFAKELFCKVLAHFEKFQPMVSEIHKGGENEYKGLRTEEQEKAP